MASMVLKMGPVMIPKKWTLVLKMPVQFARSRADIEMRVPDAEMEVPREKPIALDAQMIKRRTPLGMEMTAVTAGTTAVTVTATEIVTVTETIDTESEKMFEIGIETGGGGKMLIGVDPRMTGGGSEMITEGATARMTDEGMIGEEEEMTEEAIVAGLGATTTGTMTGAVMNDRLGTAGNLRGGPALRRRRRVLWQCLRMWNRPSQKPAGQLASRNPSN